jgi:threonine dehydrogenase-like Zn-dependent dehydrogenase
MKIAVAGSSGQVEWLELDKPIVGSGSVLLRPLACGICSTDVKQARPSCQGGPRYALGHELEGRSWPLAGGPGGAVETA